MPPMRRFSSSSVGAIGLVGLALALPARAEPELVAETPSLPAATEVADAAVSAWTQLRATLVPAPGDPSLGREVATRVLHITAGLALPGIPLPSINPTPVPDLDTVPVADGILSSTFGTRRDPIHRRHKHHAGVDFSADRGTAVLAAASGLVIEAERKGGYGRMVSIDHGAGFVTRYAHLSSIMVREGEHVPAGARIGKVGSTGRATGPHLHFELRVHGHAIDPLPSLGIEVRPFAERLGDLLRLPFRQSVEKPRHRRSRDRS
jgi:murein DD-endopeptidase MepM/ murein hydrolase activator NlpD